MDRTIAITGDPHIGVFCRVFEEIAVMPPEAPVEFRDRVVEAFDVEPVVTSLQESSLIGPLLCGNRKGLVVSGSISGAEKKVLTDHSDVFLLSGPMNAAGNVILANDSFAVFHPGMPAAQAREVQEFLGVPATHLTFGGIGTVGMAAVATNRGVVINPRSTPQEIASLQSLTDLPVGKGSVNMGSGLVGAGLLANSRGYLAGIETSGYELGRIEDIFGFLE